MAVLILLTGLFAGFFLNWLYHKRKCGSYTRLANTLLKRAEQEAELLKEKAQLESKEQSLHKQQTLEHHLQTERQKLHLEEKRLAEREDSLERRMLLVESKLSEIEKKETILEKRRAKLNEEKNQAARAKESLTEQLTFVAGLTEEQAKEKLLEQLKDKLHQEMAQQIRQARLDLKQTVEKEAQSLLATTIHRLALPFVSEATITTVSLPSDAMKGRIIGREGRNIRSLEQETGVDFIVDDTPGAIVLSCFDPIRKQIAKQALTELIRDGRIHPTRISQVVAKAKEDIDKQILDFGEDSALRAGVSRLHPELIRYLGMLHFRFSYGQNVLEHSIEVSHLLRIMAEELGLDASLARRIGLLHDIGKAVSHKTEGTHALIGRDLALKYGEEAKVANGIGCHHFEIEPICIEASLCATADQLSGGRPGARSESVEHYIRRLYQLEEIAISFPGVEKAYALQAGREVRVSVLPDLIDDDGLVCLVRDIAQKIEQSLAYPGKIKVTAIRERRSIEYAL